MIIRSKNEGRFIDATLRSVLGQVPAPDEVIVIDSGSTDDTLAVAARHGVRILTIPPAHWSYSRALNRAASEATGEVLVFLSAHCRPTSAHWLRQLVSSFDDPKVAAVWGPSVRPHRRLPEPGPPLRQEAGTYGAANRWWGLSNTNSAVRRSLWEELPFDESMPGAEDKAWGRAAMNRGYVIVHDPSASVWHGGRSLVAAYRRNRAAAAGFRMMFPELRPTASQSAVAGRTMWRTARFHVRNRQWKPLVHDLRCVPAWVAATVGDLLGGGRR